jgi:phosphate transport system substrate-binding protein
LIAERLSITRVVPIAAMVAAIALVLGACGGTGSLGATNTPTNNSGESTATPNSGGGTPTQGPLSGTIEIDGSSTVFPITQAVAEEFNKVHPDVRVNVGVSGTGGGFERFTSGDTAISNASRPISAEEAERAAANGIEFVELKVGTDGLSVIVHPENDWVDCLTVEELNAIWMPESTLNNWSQIREGFPDRPLRLYGPDSDSGTFDYFTEEINGEAQASRGDYTASPDDNVLVQGISGDRNSLGYFGYAYYIENEDRLKALGIDSGPGCVVPSPETIESGDYTPLSRPLFIYLNEARVSEPQVAEFVRYYMQVGAELAAEVGYVPVAVSVYEENLTKAGL